MPSKLSLVPSFPTYAGPLPVGTVDVELPVDQLDSPAPAPDETIRTIQYRIFYPCAEHEGGRCKHKHPRWLPTPQRAYIAAYIRSAGAGQVLSQLVAHTPGILTKITIPACEHADLLLPTTDNGRWPVMIFSHGLGGTRNTYSHLCRSIASHGVIVVAPQHRDGSAPLAPIRRIPTADEKPKKKPARVIQYIKLPHSPTPEVHRVRDAQLKIRLWELGLVFDSLVKLDAGHQLTNLSGANMSLTAFARQLGLHEPGAVTFAGHSFGAATTAQFIKSIYFASDAAPANYTPLYQPSPDAALCQQVSPETPVVLLDTWCLPLRSPQTQWLWSQPMPCYAPEGPGGARLLAVESEFFWNWRVHLKTTKRLLSPDPTADECFFQGRSEPHFYFADTSAHMSQSDFGVLFPWICKKVFSAVEPERLLRLNTRAVLQLMRDADVPVRATSAYDMELSTRAHDKDNRATQHDTAIFNRRGQVRGWNFISTDITDLTDVDSDLDYTKMDQPVTTSSPAPSTRE